MTRAAPLSDEHRQLIRQAATACDLGDYAPRLEALARPSLVLATSPEGPTGIPIGATKIGGLPDVPEEFRG